MKENSRYLLFLLLIPLLLYLFIGRTEPFIKVFA